MSIVAFIDISDIWLQLLHVNIIIHFVLLYGIKELLVKYNRLTLFYINVCLPYQVEYMPPFYMFVYILIVAKTICASVMFSNAALFTNGHTSPLLTKSQHCILIFEE
eukprot:301673_1